MPQHGQYHTPVVEWAGWAVSVLWRPVAPLIDLIEYYGIALVDAMERRTRWFRNRLRKRWRWQLSAAVVLVACATITFVSMR